MSRALMFDQKLRAQVQTERKITREILLTIQEIDITQAYRELGYSSLYEYLYKGIGYSEGAANRRISASRLLRQCPDVATKIQAGKINLSQLALVQSAVKQEEKKFRVKVSKEQKQETLKTIEGKNHHETQKILVETFQAFVPPKPRVVPTKNKKVQVTLEFDETDWQSVKDLLARISHKVPDQKVESALIYWVQENKKRKEKIAKSSEKQMEKSQGSIKNEPILTTAAKNSPPKRWRKYISVNIKRQIFQKAEHQCEYISPVTKQSCGSQYFLDTEHRVPLALGGTDDIENLRVMCRAHNQLLAKEMHLSR